MFTNDCILVLFTFYTAFPNFWGLLGLKMWVVFVRCVTALTWLASGQNVLGDGDSVLRAAGPVHHAPPALHREADVCMTDHWTLVDAQNCNREVVTTETFTCNTQYLPLLLCALFKVTSCFSATSVLLVISQSRASYYD